jgi:hypothetical protein
MSVNGRLARLERDLGTPPGEREARFVMVLYDPSVPLVEGELDAFLQVVSPDRAVTVFMLPDNGRDPDVVFPSATVAGDGWRDAPLPIKGGRILGDWRGEG